MRSSRKSLPNKKTTKTPFLHTSYRLRIWVVFLALALLTISLYVLDYFAHNSPYQKDLAWLQAIPVQAIADACLTTLIIGFAYEWFIRTESEGKLRELFSEQLQDERSIILDEIPRALWTDPSVIETVMDPKRVEQIIQSGLRMRLGDQQLADDIHAGLLRQTFDHETRWENLRYIVTLTTIRDDVPREIKDRYYDAYIDVRYETRLKKSQFLFSCIPSEQYPDAARDAQYDLRARFERSPTIPDIDESVFDVDYCRVGSLSLDLDRETTPDGRCHITCSHTEMAQLVGSVVTVAYRYKLKANRRSHVYTVDINWPTKGVVIEFDYHDTDIRYMNVLTYFVTAQPAVVRSSPPARPRKQDIEVRDWVFPKGGAVFVWLLNSEIKPEFFEMIAAERKLLDPQDG